MQKKQRKEANANNPMQAWQRAQAAEGLGACMRVGLLTVAVTKLPEQIYLGVSHNTLGYFVHFR